MKTIITYGTFDMFHIGHLNLLQSLKQMGDRLIVGVSSDEFNLIKNKKTIIPYDDRARIVSSLRDVDLVIPEYSWEQKAIDIQKYNVNVFAMGNDWQGKFDELKPLCDVVYLPRTEDVSSSQFKEKLRFFDKSHIEELKQAMEMIGSILEKFN